jgi:hypothetical protein
MPERPSDKTKITKQVIKNWYSSPQSNESKSQWEQIKKERPEEYETAAKEYDKELEEKSKIYKLSDDEKQRYEDYNTERQKDSSTYSKGGKVSKISKGRNGGRTVIKKFGHEGAIDPKKGQITKLLKKGGEVREIGKGKDYIKDLL